MVVAVVGEGCDTWHWGSRSELLVSIDLLKAERCVLQGFVGAVTGGVRVQLTRACARQLVQGLADHPAMSKRVLRGFVEAVTHGILGHWTAVLRAAPLQMLIQAPTETISKSCLQGFVEAVTSGVRVRASAVVVPERSIPGNDPPRWFFTYRYERSFSAWL